MLVEDSEDDVFVFERALKSAGIVNPLRIVGDGQKAIDYLSGAGEYADRSKHPMPSLVFLDLKLPYVNGFDVLQWIRKNRELESVVAVVLTSSSEDRDHNTAYGMGARSYIVKPPDVGQLTRLMDSLQSHWNRFDQQDA